MAGGRTRTSRSRVHDLEVDATVENIVLFFRIAAWLWMLSLVIATLIEDEAARAGVVVGAIILATVWTGATVWVTQRGNLGAAWFVAADGVVALTIGASSYAAGAAHTFHAGMPMSWVIVAGYGFGVRAALLASVLLAGQHVLIRILEGNAATTAAGALIFPVFAATFGLAVDRLRNQERSRRRAETMLIAAQRERVRHEERAELANRLHDSVLQTLQVIRSDADDPNQVRYLARRQERELRRTIDEFRSSYDPSFRAALLAIADEVEDTYRVSVETVIREDAELTDELTTVVAAVKEALVNAAKHSGEDRIDLYAEVTPHGVRVFVRDRGIGFDHQHTEEGGLTHSLVDRVRAAGGDVVIDAGHGRGTEVAIVTARLP